MAAYLVRMIHSHELVGFFVCARSELESLVDQCCDPYLCEACPLPEGGIMWPGKTPNKVPANTPNPDDDGITFDGAELVEPWSNRLWVGSNHWFTLRSLPEIIASGDFK